MHAVPSNSFPSAAGTRRAARGRWVVAATEFAIGIAAVFGGYGLLSDAEGLGAKQAWLDGTIFPDYTVPGLFLLVVIGGGMLCAAVLTVVAERFARVTAGVMATLLVLWGSTETVTIGWRGWQQIVLVAAFVAAPALLLAVYAARGRLGSRYL